MQFIDPYNAEGLEAGGEVEQLAAQNVYIGGGGGGGFMGILPPAGMDDGGGGGDDMGPPRPQRNRRRPREEEIDEEETEKEPEFRQTGATDLLAFFRTLGEPTAHHRCFGCRYLCMEKAGKIPDTRLREVFQVMAAGIGITCPLALSMEVSILQVTC